MKEYIYSKDEPVIGLEEHIQLLTRSKAFSSDKNEFGDIPIIALSRIELLGATVIYLLKKLFKAEYQWSIFSLDGALQCQMLQ